MRICYVKENMRSAYDAFVKGMPHGSFRQGYAWGEVMKRENNLFRIAAERDGSISGVISLQVKKLPGTPFSFFYAPRGPVLDFADGSSIKAIMEEVYRLARQCRAVFLRIDPDVSDQNAFVRTRLLEHGFRYLNGKDWSFFNYPRILMRLDTKPDEETLLKGMRKKHRQHINTVKNRGIEISEIREESGLPGFYRLMQKLSIRKGFPVRAFQYYEGLFRLFGRDVKILAASHQGETLGAVLSLIYGDKCWYMHGASTENKVNLHPNEALHWEMIKWAKSRECAFYDLGGSGTDYPPREDNPNYRLYHYKKGFGAEIDYLTGYYDLVLNRPIYQMFRLAEEKGLPLAMNFISSLRKRYSEHE